MLFLSTELKICSQVCCSVQFLAEILVSVEEKVTEAETGLLNFKAFFNTIRPALS